MTADIRVTWKLLLTYLVCSAHTGSVHVMMTAEKAVLGQPGTVRCSAEFQNDEVNPEVELRISGLDVQFVWTPALNTSWPDADADGSKHSLDVETSQANTVLLTLKIGELACQDEGSYVCTATVVVVNTTLSVQSSQQVELRVEVPPTAPGQLVLIPETLEVREHDWIDVVCTAVSGHTKATLLMWKLYSSNHTELLPYRDPRIILQEAHNMSADRDCLRQVTSRLRLVMTRKDQGCYVACFVWDPDLHPSLPPRCDHEEKDLCTKTPRLQVHYGVTEETMQLYVVPETEVTEGTAVSLVCHAEGYPAVNYTWHRAPPLGLSTHVDVFTLDRNTSQLLIASFNSKSDTGIYKCTAWNWVLGVKLFTASQEIFLSSSSPAQKHSVLADSSTLKKLEPMELVLLGAAVSAFTVFMITLLVVIISCICRCRSRRRQPSPEPKPLKSALRKSRDDSGSSVHTTESVSDQMIRTVTPCPSKSLLLDPSTVLGIQSTAHPTAYHPTVDSLPQVEQDQLVSISNHLPSHRGFTATQGTWDKIKWCPHVHLARLALQQTGDPATGGR